MRRNRFFPDTDEGGISARLAISFAGSARDEPNEMNSGGPAGRVQRG